MKRLKITTLDKGWYDKDEVLLHVAFQLLTDFVEQERPDKIVDWDFDEQHKAAWEEITALQVVDEDAPQAPQPAGRQEAQAAALQVQEDSRIGHARVGDAG